MKISKEQLTKIKLNKLKHEMYNYEEQKWMNKSAFRNIGDKRKKKLERILQKEMKDDTSGKY
jgi:hypothetical protein